MRSGVLRRRRRADPRLPARNHRIGHGSDRETSITRRSGGRGRELVAIDDARLVGLDDGRFLQRRGFPFAQERMREQRAQIAGGRAVGRDAVGAEAKRDRRIEGVGERERAAQVRSAAAPNRRRPSVQISFTRAMSAASAVDHGRTSTRSRTHIVISFRSAEKPECISAAMDRAHARATGSAGHMPGCRSARYSAIASESQTTTSPSCKHGHARRRRERAIVRIGLHSPRSATITSRNGAPESFIASQPRSDHDE